MNVMRAVQSIPVVMGGKIVNVSVRMIDDAVHKYWRANAAQYEKKSPETTH